MTSPSPFQLLPHGIAETIVKRVASDIHQLSGGVACSSEEYDRLLIPLLWVCHNFRVVVYSCYCKICTIELSMPLREVFVTCDTWPSCLPKAEYPVHLSARELVIQLKFWMILTGDALVMLSSEPYSGCPFPLVELLTLRFASGTPRTDLDIDAAVIVSNIDAFMSRLLQMAPLVSELVLEGSYLSRNYSATAKPQLTNLVTRLYQQYKRIMNHIHYNAEFTGPQLRAIHGLVRFDYTAYTGYSQAFQLARQSALTLQSLGITFGKAVDISGLFRDADDGYIEYTRLQALSLRLTPGLQSTYSKRSKSQWDASGDIGKLPTFTDATPFPVLLRLCLDIEYPFGDDTLFRGNRATLEYLELQLYPVTSGIIDKHRLFTLSSHPKLQCVLTREAYKPKSRKSGTTDFRYLNFLVKIGPRAQVRRILDIPQCSLLPPYDTSSEDFVHVRVLSLPGLRVEFPEVVMIFGSLPSLSDLCTMCPSFDSIPEGVRRDELWAYLVANKYMASEKQFKTWVFSDSQEYTRAHIVSCLRMVAMVCSVLDCISSQAGNCDILEGDMDEILVLQGFKQHAERMWRVISK